jgi:histidine triad (HIT) family protein
MIPLAVRRLLIHLYGKVMMSASGCLFCKIIERKTPAAPVYADDRCIVIEDIHPQAPVHLLVIPRRHLATLAEAAEEDEGLMGHLLFVAARVALEKGTHSFRTVINTNAEAGQSIYHLHVHVLGGRILRWPPG